MANEEQGSSRRIPGLVRRLYPDVRYYEPYESAGSRPAHGAAHEEAAHEAAHEEEDAAHEAAHEGQSSSSSSGQPRQGGWITTKSRFERARLMDEHLAVQERVQEQLTKDRLARRT